MKGYKSPGQYIIDQYVQKFDDIFFPLWMNLGFWRNAQTYADACRDLAALVADSIELNSSDELLDVGFGFGQPARFWYETVHPKRIVGLNIDERQCRVANARAATIGGADSIFFILGSATQMPIADRSFDKVIALESPFYFNTREDFLREAFRVLRPGGRLAIADLLPTDDWQTTEHNKRVRWYSMKPEENVYPLDEYIKRLRGAGFVEIEAESIREDVFPGIAKVVTSIQNSDVLVSDLSIQIQPEERRACSGVELWEEDLGLGNFAVFSARRPLNS